MARTSPDEYRHIVAEQQRLAILQTRCFDPSLRPVYTGPGTGYLRTGFTLPEVCAMGIVEAHPATMRYEAFKEYVRRLYSVRGTRPPGTRERLAGLRGAAAQVAHLVSEKLTTAYVARQRAREAGLPESEFPKPPSPRGAAAMAIASARPRDVVRPALSWHEQAIADLRTLIALGHKIPFSITPSQTRYTKAGKYGVEAVPLPLAYHSPRSCSGVRETGARCQYCLRGGKRHTARPFMVAYPDAPMTGPTLPHELVRA